MSGPLTVFSSVPLGAPFPAKWNELERRRRMDGWMEEEEGNLRLSMRPTMGGSGNREKVAQQADENIDLIAVVLH